MSVSVVAEKQNWTLDHLKSKHSSIPFNPLIANTFFRSGYIESWGRGIEKIHRECLEWGIAEPAYDYSMTGLMLSFEANSEQISTAGEKTRVETQVETRVEVPLKTPDKILAVLADTPDVSLAELAYIIDKSVSAVERAVAKLVSDGRLRHVGPKKGGRWEVLAVRDKAQNTD